MKVLCTMAFQTTTTLYAPRPAQSKVCRAANITSLYAGKPLPHFNGFTTRLLPKTDTMLSFSTCKKPKVGWPWFPRDHV